ncbi:MAG: MFS transporter [Candidatus Pacearchaeota archaeon]|nr:MFS transporter [Candidatus Pacearchaeota archaeon]
MGFLKRTYNGRINKKMNKTLRLLMFSDIFVLSGFGLIAPILAIFIKDNLIGGTILAAGIASMIFLITHSVLQLIFAYKFNPKDRIWMLWLGTGLIALVPFGYIFAKTIYHIYAIQFVYGVGAAFAYPSWASLFTANLEKGKRGFQWSIYSSSVGIGTAITAGVGAWLADKIGFQLVFVLTGILAVVGLLILLKLEKKILKKT